MLTIKEASKKWDLTEKRVSACCRDGKIIGARKAGKSWLIPENAEKPRDGRFKNETAAEIVERLAAEGIALEKRQIALAEPFKVLGKHDVALHLHPEVQGTLKIEIVAETEPAE